jgi:hypothetical protein
MLREVERFTAKEPNGICHTVSCLQEYVRRKAENGVALLPGTKLFRTSSGVFLKEVDEFTFHILGSGKMLHKQVCQNRVMDN